MSAVLPSETRAPVDLSLRRIYLIRAGVALVWAVAFASSSSALTAATMALLIVYPGIDVVASLADARTHRGAGVSRVQLVNAGLSVAAVVAVAITSTNDSAAVLRAFGTWALVSGLIQLAVAVNRRARVGWQWAMLLSGIGSTGAGLSFLAMAGHADPSLHSVSRFVGFGAILFVVSAFLLGRGARSRSTAS